MLLYIGAVVEAKAQLVGIHERVRSDVEGNITQSPSSQANGSNATQGVKRVATATNPNAEDAAELLRYISFLCNVARSIHFFILYPPPPTITCCSAKISTHAPWCTYVCVYKCVVLN